LIEFVSLGDALDHDYRYESLKCNGTSYWKQSLGKTKVLANIIENKTKILAWCYGG